MPTHLNPNDPSYTHDARSIKRYACPTCAATFVSYSDGAPYCDACMRHAVPDGIIPEREVLEIKNTVKGPALEPIRKKKGRTARFTEDLVVRGLKGSVYPVSGGPALHVLVNMDAQAFTNGTVMLKWGELEFMTSLNEIDAAIKPLDPTPRRVSTPNPDGTSSVKVITPNARRIRGKIGPIDMEGGKNYDAFHAGVVTFRHKSMEADFALPHICQVLAKAI